MKLNKNVILSLFLAATLSFCACKEPNVEESSSGGNVDSNSSVVGGGDSSDIEELPQPSVRVEIADTDVVLCENETSRYQIVVGKDCNIAERYAAEELAKYLALSTGAELPIVTDESVDYDTAAYTLSVGATDVLSASDVTVAASEITEDGYKIVRKGNQVLIAGGGYAGTVYGVQEFLKYQIGYEAYATDEIYYEKRDTLYLKDFHYTDIPDFDGRHMDGLMQFDLKLTSLYRFDQWGTATLMYGGKSDFMPGNCETMLQFIPQSKYNDPNKPETYHPEWYPVGTKNVCMTNTELIETFAMEAIEIVKKNTEAKILNIAEEDGGILCGCDNCKAEITTYGASGYFVRFVNTIIEKVEAWKAENCPQRELVYSTFAYQSGTIHPPVDKNEDGTFTAKDASCIPHEKLYIRLAPINYCYSHAFNDDSCKLNKVFMEDVNGWLALTNHFMVWDYSCNYYHYALFFNDYEAMQRSLQFYKEIGVTNIFRENTTSTPYSPFNYLRGYLNGKLMWDVNQNAEELMDAFFVNYYKDCEPYVRECFDLLRTHFKMLETTREDSFHFLVYDKDGKMASAEAWPRNLIDQALAKLNKAMALCDGMADGVKGQTLKKRVLSETLAFRYMQIKNFNYYGYDQDLYRDMVDSFYEDAKALNMVYIKEGVTLETWYGSL